ncbi:MAG: hypothetical protein M1833_005782 [Piccolia ochrophora]|nr:MAG: hypothetical protein M1833_005782 [Piccolia ochrophora]
MVMHRLRDIIPDDPRRTARHISGHPSNPEVVQSENAYAQMLLNLIGPVSPGDGRPYITHQALDVGKSRSGRSGPITDVSIARIDFQLRINKKSVRTSTWNISPSSGQGDRKPATTFRAPKGARPADAAQQGTEISSGKR